MTATPMAPVAPTRGLRVQGMPWRQWLRTTPGRLRAASAILLLALLLFAVVTTVATEVRSRAAGSVQTKSAPELVAVEGLYGSLADADAIASTIYLRAGAEPPELRRRYLADVQRRRAACSRTCPVVPSRRRGSEPRCARSVSSSPGTPGSSTPLGRTSDSGIQVEGGAYLRLGVEGHARADPPGRHDAVPGRSPHNLDENYRSGTSTSTAAVVVVVGVAMLGLLVLVQVYVRRRSNRLLNVGLVGATVLVIAIMGGTLWKFATAHDALNRAQSRGSDSVEVLSSARILALLAQNNENLALVERGSGDVYVAEFEPGHEGARRHDGPAGCCGYAARSPTRTGDGDGGRAPRQAVRQLRDAARRRCGSYDDRGDVQPGGRPVGRHQRRHRRR